MPIAARVSDDHECLKTEPGPIPHVGGLVMSPCETTVLIGGKPAAREGDKVMCVGPPDTIKVGTGAQTVLIGGKPAARFGDKTDHDGTVLGGCPTVHIGDTPQGASFKSAGAPLVKSCERPGAPVTV